MSQGEFYSSIGIFESDSEAAAIEKAKIHLAKHDFSQQEINDTALIAVLFKEPKKRYLYYTATVCGYEFTQKMILDDTEDDSEENLWILAHQHSHFAIDPNEKDELKAIAEEGVSTGRLELDCGYWITSIWTWEE